MTGTLIEYPCTECGHDGPHAVVTADATTATFECVGCCAEVDVRLQP